MGITATVRLNWRGAGTVQSVASFLERQGSVALGLAPDLHHSLFVHLHPQAPPGHSPSRSICRVARNYWPASRKFPA